MLQKNSSLKTLGHNLSNNVSKDPKLLGHICFQSLLSLAAHWARLVTTSSYARFLKTSHHFLRLLITSWDFSSLLRLITLSVIVHHQQHHQVSRKLMLFLMAVGSTTSTWIDRNSWPHFKLRNWSSLFEVKHNAWTESLPYEWFTNLNDYFWSRKRWWPL